MFFRMMIFMLIMVLIVMVIFVSDMMFVLM